MRHARPRRSKKNLKQRLQAWLDDNPLHCKGKVLERTHAVIIGVNKHLWKHIPNMMSEIMAREREQGKEPSSIADKVTDAVLDAVWERFDVDLIRLASAIFADPAVKESNPSIAEVAKLLRPEDFEYEANKECFLNSVLQIVDFEVVA